MGFIEDLNKRRRVLSDVINNEEYSGIREIVEDLYPDRAHFIFELLQNAEDTGASEVTFTLEKDSLYFEHNGRPFNEKDVEAITNIGKGTKRNDTDKIGKFGIGFKAVFLYSETPHIWSPTYSFKITDLVLPFEIEKDKNIGSCTRFNFPFNNPEKPREIAYKEVAAGLENLSETVLLFLNSISLINWTCNGSNGHISRNNISKDHINITITKNEKEIKNDHYLRFSKEIKIEERCSQNVSIAYKLEFLKNIIKYDKRNEFSKQFKIIPVNPGLVSVFFPAEKETSGLRFHVNAPFIPELSRASIKDTAANEPLFGEIAEVAAQSLHSIKKLGLLNVDFLAVLPNHKDTIPERYDVIRQSIVDEMNNEPLTPTQSRGHEPAKNLLQAKASLKELISESDLKFFFKDSDQKLKWAIGASLRNSDQEYFLEGLSIKTWDIDNFIKLLSEKFLYKKYLENDIVDEKYMNWLSKKSVKWHQNFYSLLYDVFTNYNSFIRTYNYDMLNKMKIVRLSDGNYSVGSECYFPTDDVEHDDVLPRVDKRIYETGKEKNPNLKPRDFLEKIGVSDVDEEEEMKGLLKSKYRWPNTSGHTIKDLSKFINFLDKFPANADIFSMFYILKDIYGNWRKPSEIFIDMPSFKTGLSLYYNVIGEETKPTALSEDYCKKIDLEKLISFTKAIGVIHSLPVKIVRCHYNPQWSYLASGGGRCGDNINEDYTIKELDKLIDSPNLELSKLVWQTMNSLDTKYLTATFRWSQKSGSKHADSQLIHMLKNKAWVPQKKEGFKKPCDSVAEKLPEGFSYDGGKEWLKKIEFGKTYQLQTEEYQIKANSVKELGFESIEEAQKLSGCINNLKQYGMNVSDLLAYIDREIEKKKVAFPVRDIMNIERREGKMIEQFNESPDKRYEKRERKVRVTDKEFREMAYEKLKMEYTNDSGQLFCQICKDIMPFKKLDGEYYFETVELLSKEFFTREHEAQYICLCPLCSAMYNEFVKRDLEKMGNIRNQIIENAAFLVNVSLGGLNTSIQFVGTHWHDIKQILNLNLKQKEQS